MDKKGKENINVSERQEGPLRQVWGNQSNFHPPGLEWKFPNFSSMGWDIASDLPLLSQAGWGSHGLHSNCGLHVWKEETQQSVRRINLSWVCNTSQVPAWLHSPPRCTGHPWKKTLQSPVDKKHRVCKLVSLLPTRVIEWVGVHGQMKPLRSMDEKCVKYWQGHLFPAVLSSSSRLLRLER